jgi:tripartite-type tricarboxylate transporter receptor subunit TctC
MVARLVAAEISGPLGQPVVVENRAPAILFPGVAKAVPDGYTLLVAGGSLWLSTAMSKVSHSIEDYAPISKLIRAPYVLVVHPSLPVRTVADLIKLAKAKPGGLNYSSGGNGSASHIAGELFKSMAGVDIVRIAYKAQAGEIVDLLSGQVQINFGSGGTWDAQIKARKLRALASAGSERSLLFPDLPTVAETLPGFSSELVLAFLAPAKTPDAIIRRLNQETGRALEKPELRDRLLKGGLEPAGGTPNQLADTIKSDMAQVRKMIADGAIKPE